MADAHRAQVEKQQEAERKAQNEWNATRTDYRTQLYAKKQQEHSEKLALKHQEAQDREKRLQSLVDATPYAEKLANMTVCHRFLVHKHG